MSLAIHRYNIIAPAGATPNRLTSGAALLGLSLALILGLSTTNMLPRWDGRMLGHFTESLNH
jgi:hypothetical protein